MKTDEVIKIYVTPETKCYVLMCEGVLCQSGGGTNEGVDFEDWN